MPYKHLIITKTKDTIETNIYLFEKKQFVLDISLI